MGWRLAVMVKYTCRAAAALTIAALLAGCGEDAPSPKAATAELVAEAADASISAATIARPMDEQVALEKRAEELAAKLKEMSDDDLSRGEILAEVESLKREIGRANAARLKRDAEEAKKLILEKRRGGTK